MRKDQEMQETQYLNRKNTVAIDHSSVEKKPYETPRLTKLGDVATLTNVSVIV